MFCSSDAMAAAQHDERGEGEFALQSKELKIKKRLKST
jgi:hypothetical protein